MPGAKAVHDFRLIRHRLEGVNEKGAAVPGRRRGTAAESGNPREEVRVAQKLGRQPRMSGAAVPGRRKGTAAGSDEPREEVRFIDGGRAEAPEEKGGDAREEERHRRLSQRSPGGGRDPTKTHLP
jgi:hypothetical protein